MVPTLLGRRSGLPTDWVRLPFDKSLTDTSFTPGTEITLEGTSSTITFGIITPHPYRPLNIRKALPTSDGWDKGLRDGPQRTEYKGGGVGNPFDERSFVFVMSNGGLVYSRR